MIRLPAAERRRRESAHNKGRLKRLVVLALGVMIALTFTTSCVHKPVELNWKLEEGKTYVYHNEVTGKWRIEGWELGERSGEFGNLLETEMKVVAKEGDSVFKIDEVVRLIRDDKKLVTSMVTYNMSADGKIYGLLRADTADVERLFTSAQRRKSYVEQAQPTFPRRKLKPGETWVQETRVVLDDRVVTTVNEFHVEDWEKVDGFDDLCLKITYHGEMVIPYERKGRPYLDKGTVSAAMWFAPEAGMIIQLVDTSATTTSRVVAEGEKEPARYIVENVRLYKLVEIR